MRLKLGKREVRAKIGGVVEREARLGEQKCGVEKERVW
jgi:hypothetical protein